MIATPATPAGFRREAGTPRYEKPELWLGTTNWHGGFCDAPPRPSGGQAPALHFLIPPSTIGLQFGTFRRWRAGIEVDWRAHPGSESGTCFRTNRPCRLAPAHQGMKSRSCGSVQRIGTADSASPHPAPAGDKPPRYIFSFRHRPSVYNSARFAGGKPASRLIEIAEWRGSPIGRAPKAAYGRIFVRMTKWGREIDEPGRCGFARYPNLGWHLARERWVLGGGQAGALHTPHPWAFQANQRGKRCRL